MTPRVPSHLYLIHLALMLTPAIFAAVIFLVVLPGAAGNALSKDESRIYQTVAAALAVIGVGLSQLMPRFMMRGEKHVLLRQYVSMKIVQWALVEGSAFFIAVVFYLTQEKNMLIPLGVLIALIAMLRPTSDEMDRFNVRN